MGFDKYSQTEVQHHFIIHHDRMIESLNECFEGNREADGESVLVSAQQ